MAEAAAIGQVVAELTRQIPPFFAALGAFEPERAVSFLKQRSTVSKLQIWADCIAPLVQLAECEGLYHSLQYLEFSYFRKDSLKQQYQSVPVGFKLIVGVCRRVSKDYPPQQQQQQQQPQLQRVGASSAASSTAPAAATSLGADIESCVMLLQETASLVQARLAVMQLYRALDAFDKVLIDFAELRATVGSMLDTYRAAFTHPHVAALADNVLTELDILHRLFEVQLNLQAYKYTDSIFSLALCRQTLAQWTRRKEGSVEWKKQEPAIIGWIHSFIGALLSKHALYFHDMIREKSVEMKESMAVQYSRLAFNHAAAIEQFAQRAGAAHVCLVFEAANVPYPVHAADPLSGSLGYQTPCDPDALLSGILSPDVAAEMQPAVAFEPPRGLRSYPAVFSYPFDQAAAVTHEHWPNVVSLLLDEAHARTLQRHGAADVVWHVESGGRGGGGGGAGPLVLTYVLKRLEGGMLLLIVFRREVRRANDTVVAEFLNATTERIRLLPLFREIKTHAKSS